MPWTARRRLAAKNKQASLSLSLSDIHHFDRVGSSKERQRVFLAPISTAYSCIFFFFSLFFLSFFLSAVRVYKYLFNDDKLEEAAETAIRLARVYYGRSYMGRIIDRTLFCQNFSPWNISPTISNS